METNTFEKNGVSDIVDIAITYSSDLECCYAVRIAGTPMIEGQAPDIATALRIVGDEIKQVFDAMFYSEKRAKS